MVPSLLCAGLLILGSSNAFHAENSIQGGGFEQGFEGWNDIWSRDGSAKASVDVAVKQAGKQAVRVEHTGPRDWSLNQSRILNVEPGAIFELSGWLQVRGEGNASLCVTIWDRDKKVIDWSYGGQAVKATDGWKSVHTQFALPRQAATLQARLVGNEPATVWLDDAFLVKKGVLEGFRRRKALPDLTLSNPSLELTFHPANVTFSVRDPRDKTTWRQCDEGSLFVTEATKTSTGLRLSLADLASMLTLKADVRLDPERPEFVVEIAGTDALDAPLQFPPPFASRKGATLILPVNEGISYPVDDASLEPMSYHLYGGHGLCMPWYGVMEKDRAILSIVETPDDAAVRIPRLDSLLHLAPQWVSQKGQFGPSRAASVTSSSATADTSRWRSAIVNTPSPRASSRRLPKSGK